MFLPERTWIYVFIVVKKNKIMDTSLRPIVFNFLGIFQLNIDSIVWEHKLDLNLVAQGAA